ncbi:MAG: cyclic nucleotide-binding domain-containing protein [Georgfuchsia sp.]
MILTPRPSLYFDLDYLGGAGAYVDEVYEVIKKGPLFEEFSRQETEALCQFMHCFAASRESVLLSEGEEGDYLLLLLSGEVEVRKQHQPGQSMVIATVGPGTSLGEMSLIDGERRFATCVGIVPSDFAVMTRADLNEILLIYPRLANKFLIKLLQISVSRLRDTGVRMLTNYFSPRP